MNVGEVLTNTARSYPDRVGFIWEGQERTYQSNARAECHRPRPATSRRRGDRVALSLYNGP